MEERYTPSFVCQQSTVSGNSILAFDNLVSVNGRTLDDADINGTLTASLLIFCSCLLDSICDHLKFSEKSICSLPNNKVLGWQPGNVGTRRKSHTHTEASTKASAFLLLGLLLVADKQLGIASYAPHIIKCLSSLLKRRSLQNLSQTFD